MSGALYLLQTTAPGLVGLKLPTGGPTSDPIPLPRGYSRFLTPYALCHSASCP